LKVLLAGLRDPHLNTIEELQSATHQEPNGWSVVPGFADAAAGDYALASGSALVDQGVVIPGINDDYSGAAAGGSDLPDGGVSSSGGGCDTGGGALLPSVLGLLALPWRWAASGPQRGFSASTRLSISWSARRVARLAL
jgi:hypothetical protein